MISLARDPLIILFFLTALIAGQFLWKLGVDQVGEISLTVPSLFSTILQLATNVFFVLGSIAYAAAILLWIYLLGKFDFSYIYPFTALLYVVSLIGGRLLFGESIPLMRWFAVAIICFGVVVLHRT